MAGSIARHPYKIGLILLLLAGLVVGLLILQASFFSTNPVDSETGSEQQVSLGSEIDESDSGPDSPAATTAGGTQAPGTSTAGPAVPLAVQAGVPAGIPVSLLPVVIPPGLPGPAGNNAGSGEPEPAVSGSISGLAQSEQAQSLPGISVYLADAAGNLQGEYRITDAGGLFDFSDLPPGRYKLYFSDPSGSYESGWYGDVGSPVGAPIDVEPGGTTRIVQTMMPSSLPEHGTFTGRVTAACGGGAPPACAQAVPGVVVSAFLLEANGSGMTLRGTSVSDSNGYYTLDNLPPGDYKISFSPPGDNYAYQWYKGQQSLENAETVPLLPGQTVGKIDAILSQGGRISGTVAAGAGPLALARVDIFDKDGVIVDTMFTSGDGSYESGSLPDGNYRIRVSPPSDEYLGEWYNDKHDFASADAVFVQGGSTSGGIDIELEPSSAGTAAADSVRTWAPPGFETRPHVSAPANGEEVQPDSSGDSGAEAEEAESGGPVDAPEALPPSPTAPESRETPGPEAGGDNRDDPGPPADEDDSGGLAEAALNEVENLSVAR